MFQNNLKIALRTLRKSKIYTGINLLGLTVGIAAVLLIYRMVNYEYGFNKNFPNYEKIVRVVQIEKTSEEGEVDGYCTPLPAMDVMEETVSQFEAMARINETWSMLTLPSPDGGAPQKKFGPDEGETALFTESSFFKIFQLDWLAGKPDEALNEPGAVVLTQRMAEKFFDNWEMAPGQTLMLENIVPVTVRGVVADLPLNCDFNFPYLLSYETVKSNQDLFFFGGGWGSCSTNNQVYALLKDPSQWDAANAALAKVGEVEYKDDQLGQSRIHKLQALSDLHFDDRYGHSGSHIISRNRLQVLSGIGILILILACFNFINLATAQASLRAKEVGVRKTLGSGRGSLVGQFMSETGVLVGIALILGANLASILSPLLKNISDVPDEVPFFTDPMVWGFLLLTGVLVTLLAGLYPSLTLAGFQPVKALKSKVTDRTFGGASLRKSLVVLQFVIAQGLIIGALITILQLDFIQNKELGFAKDLVYTFSFSADSMTVARQEALRSELLQIPNVQTVSFSSDQPLSGNTWSSNFRYGSRPEDERFEISMKMCDHHYQETYGLELIAGEWYPPSDTMAKTVVNETLLRKLGVNDPQEAIGESLRLGQRRVLQIVGVVKDFHTHSLREAHDPLMMTSRKNFYWETGVKIRPADLAATTASIQKAYDKVLPEQIFSGRFLDERIAEHYQDEVRLSDTCKGFGLLAILISCLGLFGLAAHAAQQRVKEIGIRKVLGATTAGIVSLLSKDFLKLVLLGLLVATPLAYFFMQDWLADFAYRIDMEWWVFAVTGVMAILVAFLTVGFQSIKAAWADPVESLRSE